MLEDAYNQYFGIEAVPQITTPLLIPNSQYTYEQFVPKTKMSTHTSADIPDSNITKYIAENNVDDIDQLGELIRKILNAAWGSDWGEFSPELKRGEDPEDIILPQITYDIQSREVSEKTAIKPVLTDTIKEVVNGTHTGDAFNIYRQWFDCIVEFNIWGRTTLESRQIMNNFESLLGAYTGYLKKQGIAEMFFLKEMSPRQSYRFVEGLPMRCVVYYIKLERIQSVRVSTLKKIDFEVNAISNLNKDSYITDLNNSSDNIYKNQNIKYDL